MILKFKIRKQITLFFSIIRKEKSKLFTSFQFINVAFETYKLFTKIKVTSGMVLV